MVIALIFFNKHIEKLKIKAEKEKLAQEAAERKKGFATTNETFGGTKVGTNTPKGGSRGLPPGATPTFYFYNPTTIAYGKNEFLKVWGDRENQDNWRWSNDGISSGQGNLVGEDFASASESELYDPEFYISKIPTEEKAIDSLAKDRNYAYYQLGLIYKEKFKEYGLAKNRFQGLLLNKPEEKLILPTKYNLYKIYELLGENSEATLAKNEITAKYPDSRYAAILNNPELAATKDENSPESLYESTYASFENQKFSEVISKSEKYITQFEGRCYCS